MTIDAAIVATLLAVRAHAYAPYSGYCVAALVIGDQGGHYVGVNLEAVHHKSVCAEAAALAAMVAAGERRLDTIYIMGPDARPCTPCGDCRQRIREFADGDSNIVLLDGTGRFCHSYTIDELLPDAFGNDPGAS